MRNTTALTKTSLTVLALAMVVVIAACGQEATDSVTPDDDTAATTTMTPQATAAPSTTTSEPIVATTTAPATPTTTTTAPPRRDVVEVMVYLFDPSPDPDDFTCAAVAPMIRLVESPDVLAGAFAALLSGPTADETEAGYDSWFSAETGWSVESVTISDGVAYIDFSEDSPLLPNASTSCGSAALRAQLDSTAMQFPTVEQTLYSFGGDAAAFYHWLQADVPEV